MMIQFYAEHHVTYLHDLHLSEQCACRIQNRQHRRMAAADLIHDLSQFHIRRHPVVIPLDHRVEVHQRQHGVIGMVRQQLTLLRQPRTVDAVGLKDDNRQVRTDADHHQRQQQTVSAR